MEQKHFELEGVCDQINEEWEEFELIDLFTIYDKLAKFYYSNNHVKSLNYREKAYEMKKRLLSYFCDPFLYI